MLHLDAQVATALSRMPPRAGLPLDDVPARRARMAAMLQAFATRRRGTDAVVVTVEHVSRCDGSQLPLRISRPAAPDPDAVPGPSPGPVVLYAHGGGLIGGSAEQFDAVVAEYVAAARVTVVAVDYRLAPEHPWPAAQQDVTAAWNWLVERSDDLGWDLRRAAVMGDSAGAALVLRLCLALGSTDLPRPSRLVLVYPMLSDGPAVADAHTRPHLTWTSVDDRTSWRAVQAPEFTDRGSRRRWRRSDLARLPSTYLEVGQLDLYRTSTVKFAEQIASLGVDTELVLRAGVPHVFDLLAPDTEVSRRAVADRVRVLGAL